jgi:hypothetical protein
MPTCHARTCCGHPRLEAVVDSLPPVRADRSRRGREAGSEGGGSERSLARDVHDLHLSPAEVGCFRLRPLLSCSNSGKPEFEWGEVGFRANARNPGEGVTILRESSAPSPRPSPQSKSDVSDFDHVLECPNSGKPEFGWGEGECPFQSRGCWSHPQRSHQRDATQVLLGTRQCTDFWSPVGAARRQSITRLARP